MLYIFAVALSLYYILHSVLAASTVKEWIVGKAGFPKRYYRLSYNVIFVLWSILLAGLYYRITDHEMLHSSQALEWVGWGLVLLGSGIGIAALRQYSLPEFSGLEQLRNQPGDHQAVLQTEGLNGLVRHPLYLGTMVAVWGLWFAIPNAALLLTAGITTLYIFIGGWLEEQKLLAQFGEAYRVYQKEVPMIVPFLRSGAAASHTNAG